MARDYAYRSFQAEMKSAEIVVLADAGSLAGWRDPGGKGGIGADTSMGSSTASWRIPRPRFWGFCYVGTGLGVHDHIGHDAVCPEITKLDDHLERRRSRGGRGGENRQSTLRGLIS